jgi:DNA-binding MarR family transcriptional regulator
VRATPGITFTDLAAATKFERSLTSRILSRLIKAGLMERTNSETDARVFTLLVSRAGDAICAQADPMTLELERLVMHPLSESERAAFIGMVDRIRAWVQSDYAAEVLRLFPEDQARGKDEPAR